MVGDGAQDADQRVRLEVPAGSTGLGAEVPEGQQVVRGRAGPTGVLRDPVLGCVSYPGGEFGTVGGVGVELVLALAHDRGDIGAPLEVVEYVEPGALGAGGGLQPGAGAGCRRYVVERPPVAAAVADRGVQLPLLRGCRVGSG